MRRTNKLQHREDLLADIWWYLIVSSERKDTVWSVQILVSVTVVGAKL